MPLFNIDANDSNYISVLLYCLLISNCVSTQLATGEGAGGGGGSSGVLFNKCAFLSLAELRSKTPLPSMAPMWYVVRSGSRVIQRDFFFNESVPGLHILQGSATENRQQKLLIRIFQCDSVLLYGENNVSLGTELTSFFYIGKLLKITADLHKSQSAIAFKTHNPPSTMVAECKQGGVELRS